MKAAVGRSVKNLGLGISLLGLAACSAYGPAPVSDRAAAQVRSAPPVTAQIAPSTNGLHTVQRGDTLYAIAFANNLDYREIARWNQLESADRIFVDQVLRLTPPPGAVEIQPLDLGPELNARPLDAPTAMPLDDPTLVSTPQAILLPYSAANWAQVTNPSTVAAVAPPEVKPAISPVPVPAVTPVPPAAPAAAGTVGAWLWPTDGTLLGRFGAAGGKGIDIVGARNAPVIAVAPGKVVYSGSGLRGYGRLLIVKHSGEFLSAYAHNETILVKEGDTVTAGQRIALMGDSDADRVKLHFEIRRYGKPLDPLNYLPERS
jgi:lipoprotein NlpD